MQNIYQYIILFFTYSFLGWVVEVIITAILEKRKPVNRGFLTGPICPIYGTGAILVTVFLNKYLDSPITLFCMSVIIAGVLEYTTSYVMEKIFKNRWWDYSEFKYNINGRICLEALALFGILALLTMYKLNPFFFKLINQVDDKVLRYFTYCVLFITAIDSIVSLNIIINLKNISNSIRCDSTEIITKRVREILFSKTIFHKRLANSFPGMKVFNTTTVLKNKLVKDKQKLKLEKKKTKRKK